jgi:hypothetical protein
VKDEQVAELLYQAVETEKGGVQISETALRCAVNADLKQAWEEYLQQTREHERIVLEVMEKLGLDPDTETPGRKVVRFGLPDRPGFQGRRFPRLAALGSLRAYDRICSITAPSARSRTSAPCAIKIGRIGEATLRPQGIGSNIPIVLEQARAFFPVPQSVRAWLTFYVVDERSVPPPRESPGSHQEWKAARDGT